MVLGCSALHVTVFAIYFYGFAAVVLLCILVAIGLDRYLGLRVHSHPRADGVTEAALISEKTVTDDG